MHYISVYIVRHKYTRTHTHACARAHTHTHARTHTHIARTHKYVLSYYELPVRQDIAAAGRIEGKLNWRYTNMICLRTIWKVK
jgi:hypothetical protein